ncbi:hypothetical protein F5Y05DRAFT_407654 [Hypoxylon sp. FL0543]|nr:hypothetical protein F5Y05DRAFT_407654 [Hypoxylon sp. FL0543]
MHFPQDIVKEYLGKLDINNTAKHGHTAFEIGILWTDQAVWPHPPVTSGLKMVVDWAPPSHETARESTESIHLSIITADGAENVHKRLKLSGAPLIPVLETRGGRPRSLMELLKFQELASQGLQYEERCSGYWILLRTMTVGNRE